MKMHGNKTSSGHWMLKVTPLAGFTGIYAAFHGLWILAVAEWFLLASSVYYWSNPKVQFRRSVDMTVVQLCLYTHLYYAWSTSSEWAFAMYFCGCSSYILSVYLNSFFTHVFVWLFGCTGNIILVHHITNMMK